MAMAKCEEVCTESQLQEAFWKDWELLVHQGAVSQANSLQACMVDIVLGWVAQRYVVITKPRQCTVEGEGSHDGTRL